MTPPAARVLAVLAEWATLTTREVRFFTGLGHHAAWAALRKLMRAGLVVPATGRRKANCKRWKLTAVGRAAESKRRGCCPLCGRGGTGKLF